MVIILNFSHPLTRQNLAQIRALAGIRIARLVEIPVHFDDQQDFGPQVETLMAQVPLSMEALASRPLLVNLPAFAPIAAEVLAYLHALRGHFPPILRLRPVPASINQYEVAEILRLQNVRNTTRPKRFSEMTESQP